MIKLEQKNKIHNKILKFNRTFCLKINNNYKKQHF